MKNENIEYYLIDKKVIAKEGELFNAYFYVNGQWSEKPPYPINVLDLLTGYDPETNGMHMYGNSSVLNRIEIITYKKAQELIKQIGR
jgi:hypothetical protein